jgi:DNA polymerase III delta subunit
MLHLFSGNDFGEIRKATHPLTQASQQDGSYRRHAGEVTVPMLDPYFTESLFGETYTIVLDGFSLFSEDVRSFLVSQLQSMVQSQNTFLLVDEKFPKELKDEAKKQKSPIVEYSLRETTNTPSVFGFTDQYLSRDKKSSWLLLTRLFQDGVAPEEVYGALYWATKTLFLAKIGRLGHTPDELGMKPYPLEKARKHGAKWQEHEVRETLSQLVSLLESTRRNGGDLGIALESFILK